MLLLLLLLLAQLHPMLWCHTVGPTRCMQCVPSGGPVGQAAHPQHVVAVCTTWHHDRCEQRLLPTNSQPNDGTRRYSTWGQTLLKNRACGGGALCNMCGTQ
jgi:hypothetical protein